MIISTKKLKNTFIYILACMRKKVCYWKINVNPLKPINLILYRKLQNYDKSSRNKTYAYDKPLKITTNQYSNLKGETSHNLLLTLFEFFDEIILLFSSKFLSKH